MCIFVLLKNIYLKFISLHLIQFKLCNFDIVFTRLTFIPLKKLKEKWKLEKKSKLLESPTFFFPRTLIAKNISTKKYYQRISKLEIDNSNSNVEEESQISDDVNELNSRILKATESPKVQVKIQTEFKFCFIQHFWTKAVSPVRMKNLIFCHSHPCAFWIKLGRKQFMFC